MTYICGECGAEIPDDMDFCPRCGCVKEKAYRVGDSSAAVCPSCGNPVGPADLFCGVCGTKLNPVAQFPNIPAPVMRKHGYAAILLAFIPGFFNIYGLGHLVMRKWSRGLMFMAMGLIIWYINGWQLASSSSLVMILNIAVFFYQAIDITRIIYSPEDKARWTGPRSTVRAHWTGSWGILLPSIP